MAWSKSRRTVRDVEEWNRAQLAAEADQRRGSDDVWEDSPAGRARASFDRDDEMYQVSLGLDDVSRVPVALADDGRVRRAEDVSDVLDSIVREGWNLQAFSTAFVVREASWADGERHATVAGELVGTYVFSRHRP